MRWLHILYFFFCLQFIHAQVITSSTNPTVGTELNQVGSIGFDTNMVKQSGVNQSWDFKDLKPNGINITTRYVDAKTSTYGNLFPEANLLQKTTNQSDAYLMVDNSGMHLIGGILEMPISPNGYIAAKFTPVISFFDLPMQMGNKGNATTSFYYNIPKEIIPDSLLNSIPFQIDSFRLRLDVNRHFNCTGNGIIHLPKKDYPVVQVEFSLKPSQNFEVKVPIFGWIDVSQFVDLDQFGQFFPTTEGYYFFSPDHIGPVAVFNRTPEAGTLDLALISSDAIAGTHPDLEKITINTYPNPVDNFLNIDVKDKNFNSYIIIDAKGSVVRRENKKVEKIDFSMYQLGAYYLYLYDDDKITGFSRFIKI